MVKKATKGRTGSPLPAAGLQADGFGGAVMRVVEGNYPMDFYTREEKAFVTEAEALRVAEAFREFAV